MARKPKRHEEHTNHEAWAIPYGDLITLLLAFFVVMYALSTVNQGKYRLLSDSLYAAFRGEPRTLEPVQLGQHQAGAGADSHTGVLQQQRPDPQHAPAAGELVKLAPVMPQVAPTRAAELAAQAAQREAALARVADQVQNALGDLVRRNLMTVRRKEMWVEVELRTDILFTSGSAQPAPTAVPVLERLAQVLAPLPNAIRVEGYTDNVPIRTSVFYSNWELSAARAGSVVRVLSGQGVDPGRLAVVGYGEQRPVASNDTPEGRNANRRVVVVILAVESPPAEAAPASAPASAPAAAPAAPAASPIAVPPAAPVAAPATAPPAAGAAPPAAGEG
ncbi:MAG TPA: flagellar motor protein MotD [Steroidobacteraceae bacterium]|nr:flagellar motor protein MotD [Steroidobacteraceae bacterium]